MSANKPQPQHERKSDLNEEQRRSGQDPIERGEDKRPQGPPGDTSQQGGQRKQPNPKLPK